jgi:hypothetical protein
MTVIEITDFSHVILRALQRRLFEDVLKKSVTFSEIWRACDAAIDNLPGRIRPSNNKQLAAEIFEHIQFLDDMYFITRHIAGGKLQSIHLTEQGTDYLRRTIFSHQERAPG